MDWAEWLLAKGPMGFVALMCLAALLWSVKRWQRCETVREGVCREWRQSIQKIEEERRIELVRVKDEAKEEVRGILDRYREDQRRLDDLLERIMEVVRRRR